MFKIMLNDKNLRIKHNEISVINRYDIQDFYYLYDLITVSIYDLEKFSLLINNKTRNLRMKKLYIIFTILLSLLLGNFIIFKKGRKIENANIKKLLVKEKLM